MPTTPRITRFRGDDRRTHGRGSRTCVGATSICGTVMGAIAGRPAVLRWPSRMTTAPRRLRVFSRTTATVAAAFPAGMANRRVAPSSSRRRADPDKASPTTTGAGSAISRRRFGAVQLATMPAVASVLSSYGGGRSCGEPVRKHPGGRGPTRGWQVGAAMRLGRVAQTESSTPLPAGWPASTRC